MIATSISTHVSSHLIRDAIDAAKMFTGKHGGNLPADILLDQHRRDVAIASDGYIQL
jgi:hypothetical protein